MTTNKYIRTIILFLTGYCAYIAIEVTYRNISYPIMGVCGGLAIVILDKINDRISWDVDIIVQALCGGCLVTVFELIIGEIFLHTNLLPHMWSYENVPLNFDGVICLPFSLLWCALSMAAIFIADAMNYYIFGDEQIPYYRLFGKVVIEFPERQ